MKNYQIFNAYPTLVKLADMNYNDYDVNLDIALMLNDVTTRYNIISSMIKRVTEEYCVADENGYVRMNGGSPVMKPGKSPEEYDAEMQKISDGDANYDPEKIIVNRASFRGTLPSPKEILQVQDFISFVKEG